MKYYLISADDLDQIQFIPHPKRDVNVKGKIIELTEEELKAIANEKIHLSSTVDYIKGTDKIRKVLE